MPIIRHSPPGRILLLAMRLEVCFVEILAPGKHHEPSILRAVGREVQDSLDALQAEKVGRLVDVRPWGGRFEAFAFGEREGVVDPVEGGEELVGVPDFLEGGEHAGLTAKKKKCQQTLDLRLNCGHFLQTTLPDKLLVSNRIAVIHAALHVRGQMLRSPRRGVVAVEAEREFFEPLGHFFHVVVLAFFWVDGAFDDGVAVFEELVAEVAVLLLRVDADGVGESVRHFDG